MPDEQERIEALVAMGYTREESEAAVLGGKEKPEPSHEILRETGNGPTVSYEEDLLREYYGDPDDSGVYGAH